MLTAAIDSDYFNDFYRTFQLGPDGASACCAMTAPFCSLADSEQEFRPFQNGPVYEASQLSSVGYYKIISPFDGIVKYFGYDETSQFPLVVTVAMSEDWLLSAGRWRCAPTPSWRVCCCA